MPFLDKKIKLRLGLLSLLSLIEQTISILFLYLVGLMLDCINAKTYSEFQKMLLIILLLLPIQVLIFYSVETIRLSCRKEYGRTLQCKLYDNIMQLSGINQKSINKERVLNLYQTQLENLKEYIIKISDKPVNLCIAALAAIIIARISLKLLIVSCILIPLSGYLFQRLMMPMQKESQRIIQKKEEINEIIRQVFKGFYIIKVFLLRTFFEKYFQNHADNLKRQEEKKDKLDLSLGRSYILLSYIPHLLVPLYGGYLGICGEITLGGLIAVNMLIWYVLNPIQSFLSIIREKKEIEPILELLKEYDNENSNDSYKFQPPILLPLREDTPAIEMKKVNFSYNQNQYIFKNLNLHLFKGEALVLSGESGAGKSTLVKLLCGLESEYEGQILICGIPMCISTQRNLQNQIAYVPQEPYLFHGTIEENICLGKIVTKAQLEHAAVMAEAHSFIMDFEKGYDTIIGEGGILLSGGQKKRIAIARALLKTESPILLMDEPMSALTQDMAQKIIENIFLHYQDRAILIISHKPEDFIKYCPIVQLQNGKLQNLNEKVEGK